VLSREHARIGGERQEYIWEDKLDRPATRWRRRCFVEVVTRWGRFGNHEPTVALDSVSGPYQIRQYGDPVLKQVAREVTDIDGALVKLTEDMLETMYEEPGLGLAAPQVGVRKRMFVYDLELGEDPRVLINPEIVETEGEWEYEEGCLSVRGLSWAIVRPKLIHIVGRDIDGNEVSIEADELEARLFQHEMDHLNGILLVEHLDDEQRKAAMKILRQRAEQGDPSVDPLRDELGLSVPGTGGLSLP